MPGTPQAPRVLPPKAARLWQRAFSEAYEGTCANKPEGERDACAAAMAWERVKTAFRKDARGHWTKRNAAALEVLRSAARKIGVKRAVLAKAQALGFSRPSRLVFETDREFVQRSAQARQTRPRPAPRTEWRAIVQRGEPERPTRAERQAAMAGRPISQEPVSSGRISKPEIRTLANEVPANRGTDNEANLIVENLMAVIRSYAEKRNPIPAPVINITLPELRVQAEFPDHEEIMVLERDKDGFIQTIRKRFSPPSEEPEPTKPKSIKQMIRGALGLQ